MGSVLRFTASFAAFFCSLFAAAAPLHATTAELVTIPTPRGAKQSFILITPAKPVAAVILFAGGHGAPGLQSASAMAWGKGNFLVRTRDRFAALNLMVAVVDAPSDHRSKMSAVFRMSADHAGDIGAVAGYLKQRAAVPVWLVGTSMGTFSAAGGAIAAKGIDGLILTATVARAKSRWKIAGSHPDGVASMKLGAIKLPVLILSHRNDGCEITPASDSLKLLKRLTAAKAVKIVMLDGGAKPKSAPCKARSQHGFFGIEQNAVAAIAEFIKANRP